MEELTKIIINVSVPTSDLKQDVLQNVLVVIQKSRQIDYPHQDIWIKLAEKLWLHLENGFTKLDDQLLCATCFYNVLKSIEKKEIYLKDISHILDKEFLLKTERSDTSNILQVISLTYGIFQSSFLSFCNESDVPYVKSILTKIFNLLILMANDYSHYTFIVFKIIDLFKKTCNTVFQECIFSKDQQIILLNLVCHNWENPITGIKDLIRTIFKTLITIADKIYYNLILSEINEFVWNKAKYLMLAEIILQEKKSISQIVLEYPDWIEGVVNSLYKPGLVSAGADMYNEILKKIKSDDEWYTIFLTKILNVLNGKSFLAKNNFNNYWCLNTLKTYPSIFIVILKEISISDRYDNLDSILNIIKQGNKLGIVCRNWDDMSSNNGEIIKFITYGLNYINPYVRMAAFDIVCVANGTSMPSALEYNLIHKFIYDNINSDCTVLRINMLNSLKLFLNRLHLSYIHMKKQSNKTCSINELHEFCKKIQELISSLDLQGNYQRKFTLVKICEIVLVSFSEFPKKIKNQKVLIEKTLLESLKEDNIWTLSDENFIRKLVLLLRDPIDDVREIAGQLLFRHYSSDLINLQMVNQIIDEAFHSLESKFFFEINCGFSMFKLVTNMLLNYNIPNVKFMNVEDLSSFVYVELIKEFNSQKDLLKSIECGKQLHSFITLLNTILEVYLQNKYETETLFKSIINHKLLETIENISNQFMDHDNDNEFSSDFSKLNNMINNVIKQYGYDPHDNDEAQISGLHQIVLNTMWLNVKSSCELAATVIKFYKNDRDVEISRKCLLIITNVLETSRHKGAIEAAGVALGQSIKHLTSLPNESILSQLPESLLRSKLDQMINEAKRMASVTRRGAGLSIMVHRVVANDMRKGKPLFHYFIKVLLETCKNDNVASHTKEESTDSEDLPKAVYIHFLTRIVIDSTLASDMMYYSADLAEIAFDNLINDQWQIRNAALQLYGALVPKLIGQKKTSGYDNDTIATVACDELRTHSKKLWDYIQCQLQVQDTTDKIQLHSNLVPLLNIISSCAKRYNFSYDMRTQAKSDMDMFNNLINILDSPLYTVRRLTAQCIYNIYPIELICNTLLDSKPLTENLLHGYLILTHVYYKNYHHRGLYHDEFLKLQNYLKTLLPELHSYMCKNIFDEMFLVVRDDVGENINKIFLEIKKNRYCPGVFTWANTVINCHLQKCCSEMLPQILEIVIQQNDIETYCGFLYKRLILDQDIPRHILKQIAEKLLNCPKKFEFDIIWQILYHISMEDITIFNYPYLLSIVEFMKEKDFKIPYRIRYIIPFASRVFNYMGDNVCKYNVCALIDSLSIIENVDIEMRYIAALANNEFSGPFKTLTDEVKIIAIKSAVIFLQDENEDVRNISANFYNNITGNKFIFHPFICLEKLLSYEFLVTIFNLPKISVDTLCDKLNNFIYNYLKFLEKKDDYNPFANDSKNIYLECEVLEHLIKSLQDTNANEVLSDEN